MGMEPFKLRVAEDAYFCNLLLLEGPIVYCSLPLAAYRIREHSLSSNRIRLNEGEVRACELLDARYGTVSDMDLARAFRNAFAQKRRVYAKTLMGAKEVPEARRQLTQSLSNSPSPVSIAKSLGLLLLTHVPSRLQPEWPSGERQWGARSEN